MFGYSNYILIFVNQIEKAMKVIKNTTGKISKATYAHDSMGNLGIRVQGKFYNEEKFDKTFSQIDITGNYIKIDGRWQERKVKQGGKRIGAGRKSSFSELTKTVSFRCPLSKVEELKLYVTTKLSEWSQGSV